MFKRVSSFAVAVAMLFSMALTFSFASAITDPVAITLAADKTVVHPGDKVTVTVGFKNYAQNLAALAIMVEYDNNVFSIAKSDIVAKDGNGIPFFSGLFTSNPTNAVNRVYVSWADGANVTKLANGTPISAFKMVDLTFTAKSDAAVGSADFRAYFQDSNVVGVEPIGNITYTPGDGIYEKYSNTLTVTVADKQDQAVLSITNVPPTITYGDAAFTLVTSGGSGTGVVAWSSSNPNVLAVDNTGKVTVVGAGSATITATKAGDSSYNAASATANLTVAKVNQSAVTITGAPATVSYGDAAFTLGTSGGNGSGAVAWSSSDSSVLSVNAATGVVTVVGAGSATISAIKAGDANYNAAQQADLLFTVNKTSQAAMTITGAPATITYGDGSFTLNVSGGNGNGTVAWSSTNPNVLAVNATTGEVTVVGTGSATINAVKAADNNYLGTTASVTLTVGRANQAPLSISGAPEMITVDTGVFSLTVTGGSSFGPTLWTSSDPNVLAVDPISGTVTVVGVGSAVIIATKLGDMNYNDTSATLLLTVNKTLQAPLTIIGVPATVNYGDAAFTLGTSGGSGTGAVAWSSSNANVLAVNATTGAVTVVGAGSATITATKAGGNDYSDATATVTITVNKIAQSALTITGTPSSVKYGDAAFALGTSGGSGNGAVTWSSSNSSVLSVNAAIGAVTVTGTGTAVITASKAADTNYNIITATVTISVSKASQGTLTITGKPATVKYGDAAFTLGTSGGNGTGAVTWSSSDAGVLTVNPTTGAVTVVGAGSATITATKAADTNYTETAATVTIVVDKANQSSLSITGVPGTLAYGAAPFSLGISGGSGTGAVTFETSNASVLNVNATTGLTTVAAVGTATITVKKAGDANYNDATATVTITVTKGNQAAIAITGAPATVKYGDAAFTLGTSGGSGTGAVAWSSSNANVLAVNATTGAVTVVGAGSATITATKAADSNYNETSKTLTITVEKAAQSTLTVTGTPATVIYGDAAFTLGTSGGNGNGSVVWSSSDSSVLAVNATTGAVTVIGAGTATITATKAGDSNYNAVAATVNLTVAKANQSAVSITGAPSTITYGDTAFTLATTGGNGTGTLTWSSSNINVLTVDNTGKVNIVGAGTATISVVKTGDANYNAAQKTDLALSVSKASQSVTIGGAPSAITYGDAAFTLALNGVKGTGSVTWTSTNTNVLTVDNAGNVTVVGVGTATITAVKAEDGNYLSSTASIALTIGKATQEELVITNIPETITEGDEPFTLAYTGGSGTGAVTWSSSDTAVLTVDANGVVTVVAPGNAAITLTKAGDSNYEEATVVAELSVDTGEITVYYIPATDSTPARIEVRSSSGQLLYSEEMKTEERFADMSKSDNAWYYDAAVYCNDMGIFTGYGDNTFRGDASITRGEFVTAVTRMMGLGDLSGIVPPNGYYLSDLQGTWYANYAEVLVELGVINGYEDATFRGDQTITREEAAAILHRLSVLYGKENATYGNPATYTDMNTVSDWAVADVQWAATTGMFQGDDAGRLNPQSNATRGEIATLLMRADIGLNGIIIGAAQG